MPKGDKVGRGYNLVKMGEQKPNIENIFQTLEACTPDPKKQGTKLKRSEN